MTIADAPRPVLVTGAAGFIGFHVARRLLLDGVAVVGIDNLNDYYDPMLKQARLAELRALPSFRFDRIDLADHDAVCELFGTVRPHCVIHLAAQAGVRHSIENPRAYVTSNIDGFLSVLEGCRRHPTSHLVYASSSSVYGANTKVPFAEEDPVLQPVSLYAATKRSNELMAQTYAHLYGIKATGLRFFTVYGPWGRPDMAYYSFTRAILRGLPIRVFNQGRMRRDFTYVNDVVEAVVRLLPLPPVAEVPHAIYNIGNHTPVELEAFIDVIAEAIGRPAVKVYLPMQAGDVAQTYADVDKLAALTGFSPSTPLRDGMSAFVQWFRAYHSDPG